MRAMPNTDGGCSERRVYRKGEAILSGHISEGRERVKFGKVEEDALSMAMKEETEI